MGDFRFLSGELQVKEKLMVFRWPDWALLAG
jgi:hypothetical protein